MANAGAYQPWIAWDQSTYNHGTNYYPEAASLVALKGTPVILDSAGRIAPCGAGPALIFGVLCETGHNGTAGQYNVLVQEIRAGDLWVITLLETLAQNLLGQAGGDCGIVKDATTALWYASTADNGAQCRIVDYIQGPFPKGFAIGDTLVSGLFRFHSTKLQVV